MLQRDNRTHTMLDDSTRGTDILIGQLTIDQGLTNNKKSEQCDGPKASIDLPWSVRSLLLGLGHRGRSLYLVAFRSRLKLRVPMKSVDIMALIGTSIAWSN